MIWSTNRMATMAIALTLASGIHAGAGCLSGGRLESRAAESACPAALDFTVKTIDGADRNLCEYRGNVVLIVNVASKCGYTPQYKGLEELNAKYRDKGLRVLGFPSNDFGGQEPGSEAEIKKFCSSTYGVTFDMFSKVVVKGDGQVPLYKYLTSGGGDPALAGEVKWNFQKYLVDRNGKLVGVFSTKVDPMSPEMTSAIEKLL